MVELFIKGGPIMWPLLLASVTVVAILIERTFFLFSLFKSRDRNLVSNALRLVREGLYNDAYTLTLGSRDFVARILGRGLEHRRAGLEQAVQRESSKELKRFASGLNLLDTIVTLAPLLGLLGTVTGMIRAFGLLGNTELEAPSVITGGIAEALIATAYGLGIAISALVPLNYFNSLVEEARQEIEDAASELENALLAEQPLASGELANRRAL